jgi:hypothetical protein
MSHLQIKFGVVILANARIHLGLLRMGPRLRKGDGIESGLPTQAARLPIGLLAEGLPANGFWLSICANFFT